MLQTTRTPLRPALSDRHIKARLTYGRIENSPTQPLALAVPRRLDPALAASPLVRRLAPGERLTETDLDGIAAAAIEGRVCIVAAERLDEAYSAFRLLVGEVAA